MYTYTDLEGIVFLTKGYNSDINSRMTFILQELKQQFNHLENIKYDNLSLNEEQGSLRHLLKSLRPWLFQDLMTRLTNEKRNEMYKMFIKQYLHDLERISLELINEIDYTDKLYKLYDNENYLDKIIEFCIYTSKQVHRNT
jgi:hypothetical protein